MKAYKRNPRARWMKNPATAIPDSTVSLQHSGIVTSGSGSKQELHFIIGTTGGLQGDDVRYYVDLDEHDLRNAIRAWSYNEKFLEIVKEILG